MHVCFMTNDVEQLGRLGSYLLADCERHILVLQHQLDLPLHGDEDEHEPIQQQYWPEDGHIKDGEECETKAYEEGFDR